MIGPEGGRERERRCDRKGLILGVTKSMMSWTGPSGVRVAASCTSSARLALKKQHSCVQAVPGQAEDRAPSHRGSGRYLRVSQTVAHLRKECDSPGTNGEVGQSAGRQSRRDCPGSSPDKALQNQETQIPCAEASGTAAQVGGHGLGFCPYLGLGD